MITDLNGINWRLIDADKIRTTIESLVSYHEKHGTDPSDLALYLLAIGRQNVLALLFHISFKERECAFWSRDFSLTHNIEAAQKNAYNCISLNKYEYAAAFFLAAGAFQKAVETLLIGGMDNLAALLYRTHSGECYPYIGSLNIQLGKMALDFDVQLENMRQTLGMCLSDSCMIEDTMMRIQDNPLFTAMFVV